MVEAALLHNHKSMEKLTWHTEKRKIKDLIPWDKNPRKLSEAQQRQLEKSIDKFDLVEIPAVNADGRIIAGHQRLYLLNLKGRGEEEIDVRVPNRQLTPDEFAEYNLRSNKNTGEWDFEALADFDAAMLEDVGFESKELDKIYDDEDEEDEPPPPPPPTAEAAESKLGDLYEMGAHRLLVGDATKAEDLARLMNGREADMIFTDPPYGVSYVGKTKDALEIENDELQGEALQTFLASAFERMFHTLKKGGAWYVAGPSGQPFNMAFNRTLEPHNWRHTLVWVKNTFVMGRADYHYRHELLYYGWKDGAAHYFIDDRTQDSIWEFPKPSRNGEHPTMKPIELVAKAIRNSSVRGDVILDPFGGSGSTVMAADGVNRACYTMELSERYADVIVKRWEKKTGQKAIKK